MIKPDRRARIMLSCATDGGDLAVADLVQNLGAEGAWAKIIEGALGEPAAERASRVSIEVVEPLAQAAVMRFIVTTSGPTDLMIFDMPRVFSGEARTRLAEEAGALIIVVVLGHAPEGVGDLQINCVTHVMYDAAKLVTYAGCLRRTLEAAHGEALVVPLPWCI